tara:strand:- start:407 stop:529 length:123 start_codon:yes stop_codon:yes gene_type:complete
MIDGLRQLGREISQFIVLKTFIQGVAAMLGNSPYAQKSVF